MAARPSSAASKPTERPAAARARAASASLGPAGAQLAAWLVLGLIGATIITAALPMPAGGRAIRLGHYAYDAGQMLAAGLAASALVSAWLRWGPKRALWGYLGLAALSLALGRPVLGDDASGVAERLSHSGNIEPWVLALSSATALVVPVARLAAALLVRVRLRVFVACLGLALGIANHSLLHRGYAGLHLYAAWTAAMLLGGALTGVPLPSVLARLRERRRLGAAVRGALCVAAAASLVIRPPSSVLIELFKLPGAPFASFVARLQEGAHSTAVVHRPDQWFVDRRTFPPVPASKPALLPRNGVVLLLVVDCLRADLLADERYTNVLPVMTALAKRSVSFPRTWTTAPATSVAIASVFAGRYYSQLYWRRTMLTELRATILPDQDPSVRFPELLGRAGVVTVTYAATPGLATETGVLGPFAEHERLLADVPIPGEPEGDATARQLGERIIERLGRLGDEPLFLYAQFIDAHGPYRRAGPHGSDFERYLRVLQQIDAVVGRILGAVQQQGLAERTAVILTGDHGEAFGEHADRYHGRTLYETGVRVPLALALPAARARTVDVPVSLIDLGPTILDLFGQPTPGSYLGQSLLPLLRGEGPAPTRPIVIDSGRLQQAMIFPDGMKIIRDKRRGLAELYDLSSDPTEAHNLFDERPELGEQRLGLLQAFFEVHELHRKGYETPYRPP